jgi:hypothetical protein
MVFYSLAATALQRLAPAGTLGRVAGVISIAESATETASMPLAGALVAVAGIRPAYSPWPRLPSRPGRCACSGGGKPPLIANSLIEGILVGKDLNPISGICGATC